MEAQLLPVRPGGWGVGHPRAHPQVSFTGLLVARGPKPVPFVWNNRRTMVETRRGVSSRTLRDAVGSCGRDRTDPSPRIGAPYYPRGAPLSVRRTPLDPRCSFRDDDDRGDDSCRTRRKDSGRAVGCVPHGPIITADDYPHSKVGPRLVSLGPMYPPSSALSRESKIAAFERSRGGE